MYSAFDALVGRGGRHAVARPAVELVVQQLEDLAGAVDRRRGQRVGLEVGMVLLQRIAQLVVVVHRLFGCDAGVGEGVEAGVGADGDARRLPELHHVLDHLHTALVGLFGLRRGKGHALGGDPGRKTRLLFFGWR
jgi:hypothetical protein